MIVTFGICVLLQNSKIQFNKDPAIYVIVENEQ